MFLFPNQLTRFSTNLRNLNFTSRHQITGKRCHLSCRKERRPFSYLSSVTSGTRTATLIWTTRPTRLAMTTRKLNVYGYNTHYNVNANTFYYEQMIPWDSALPNEMSFKVIFSYNTGGAKNWYRVRLVGYVTFNWGRIIHLHKKVGVLPIQILKSNVSSVSSERRANEGPTLETLDFTISISSTPTFSYFDLYLYSAYTGHYTFIIHLHGYVLQTIRFFPPRKVTRFFGVHTETACSLLSV